MDVSREAPIRLVALFLLIVGIATWAGTLPGAAAFALGVTFALWILPSLERWADRG